MKHTKPPNYKILLRMDLRELQTFAAITRYIETALCAWPQVKGVEVIDITQNRANKPIERRVHEMS